MSEFLKLFETIGSVSFEQLLAFAALIVPGFISLRVYDMRRGGEGRKINEALLDVIVYSFATDLIVLAGFALISSTMPPAAQPAAKIVVAILALLILPVALAFFWFDLQRVLIRSGIVSDATTKPLERIFDRVAYERTDLGVIITLRDGRKIGGRISKRTYPASQATGDELLVGEVWTIDQERATFLNVVKDSAGILVSMADCETIEFVHWTQAVRHGRAAASTKERHDDT